jgi:hypothetical protein
MRNSLVVKRRRKNTRRTSLVVKRRRKNTRRNSLVVKRRRKNTRRNSLVVKRRRKNTRRNSLVVKRRRKNRDGSNKSNPCFCNPKAIPVFPEGKTGMDPGRAGANFFREKIFRTSTLQLLSSDFTRPSTCFTTAKSCLTTVFKL